MTEIITELDPGFDIKRRAEELGFFAAYYPSSPVSIHSGKLPDRYLFRSEVVCAPTEDEVFEPSELMEMLGEFIPAADTDVVENTQGARFENPSWLRLPAVEVVRKVGTCSLRAEITVNYEETRRVYDVKELFTLSRVVMAPTRRFAEEEGSLGVDFVSSLMLKKSSSERCAFKEAVKNQFSWWERVTAR